MNHSEDFRSVTLESVDDAIVAEDDFSVGLLPHFRDHTPRPWELLQALD
jgi:hypothetical protein